MFCSFFPPKPFFQSTLGLSFFLVIYFSSVFPNPFSDNILVVFRWLYLCCPFPFFVSASLLPTISCHPLLQSTLLSFLVVSFFHSSSLHDIVFRFGVSFFLVFFLVFVWFLCECCCHLSFHHWEFCSLIFFLLSFLLSKCGVGCFGLRLRHREKVFFLRFWCFFYRGIPIWVWMFCQFWLGAVEGWKTWPSLEARVLS